MALYYVMVRDKCETLMSIFLSWLQFMITCLKLCPTWWTFKRRLRNRGHFLNTYNKNFFQPCLCTAAPSPKKKKTENVDGSFEHCSILFIFIYLLQFNGLLNAQPFLTPPPLPPGISFFVALDGKFPGFGTLELSNLLGWGRKKRANVPSSVNIATFFIDCTVE